MPQGFFQQLLMASEVTTDVGKWPRQTLRSDSRRETCHRAADRNGRLTPGAVSPQTRVARGTQKHPRRSLPAGKYAQQILFLPLPQAAIPFHVQSRRLGCHPDPPTLGGRRSPPRVSTLRVRRERRGPWREQRRPVEGRSRSATMAATVRAMDVFGVRRRWRADVVTPNPGTMMDVSPAAARTKRCSGTTHRRLVAAGPRCRHDDHGCVRWRWPS